MKLLLTTLAVSSLFLTSGCKKTKMMSTVTAVTHADPQELDVEVEHHGGEITLVVNGKEQTIDLSELIGEIDLDAVDGEVSIAVMATSDHEGVEPVVWAASPGGHGGHGDPHGGMGAHMMHMKGGHGEHGDPHECHGGRSDHEEIPEEIQFIDELSLLHEVSVSMSDSSMALLGIHMIRDGLEPENRLEALEVIISKSSKGSSSRNAAIITAIETMRELDMMDEAADLMIELVLSN
ncbi:MAG: hypothetical protein QGI78_01290 [Phycisphaerales bacterium]|nr:hypothetical protein [Phycisphaerales bacterium]